MYHIRDTNVSVSATGQSNILETPVSQSHSISDWDTGVSNICIILETPESQSPLRAKTTTPAHAARLEFSWRVTRRCPAPRSIRLGGQEHQAWWAGASGLVGRSITQGERNLVRVLWYFDGDENEVGGPVGYIYIYLYICIYIYR